MRPTLITCLLSLITAHGAFGADIKRTPLPNSNFPISLAVSVPPGWELVFLSGALPEPLSPARPNDYGDLGTQTRSALRRLEKLLVAEGLSMADVVQARIFVVGDPDQGGRVDYAALNAAYASFFGTAEQPGKPARTTVQVAGLAWAGARVEIEFIAARKFHR